MSFSNRHFWMWKTIAFITACHSCYNSLNMSTAGQHKEQQVLNVACPDKHPNEQVSFNGTTNTSEMINPAQVLLDSDQFSNLVNGRPIASVPPPPNSERPHTCKWCGKSFKTITHMKQHVA